MANALAVVLIIYGFTFSGLEIISNTFKAYGSDQMNFIAFLLSLISGSVYTLASLLIISDPNYLKLSRSTKILPLLVAFLTLLAVKFVFTNAMLTNLNNFNSWCLFLADIVPGFGKRVILLYGLMTPSSSIGQAIDPYAQDVTDKNKTKKE